MQWLLAADNQKNSWSRTTQVLLMTGGGFGVFALVWTSLIWQDAASWCQLRYPAADSSLERAETTQVWVDISGAVKKPGVYQIDSDSVVLDGLLAAGGLSTAADQDFVRNNLNLAQRIVQGQKIVIPDQAETTFVNEAENWCAKYNRKDQVEQIATGTNTSSLVSINQASQKELESLPGIGAVRAMAIIEGRPYDAISDLTTNQVISQNIFDEIADQISI